MSDANRVNEVPHYLDATAGVLKTISQKFSSAADGFEEFHVRGSALRHMGVSVFCMADQFEMAARAFRNEMPNAARGNFILISSLLSGCAFQLKHFGLSLKSDHHHMVPTCGAHNQRSPTAESGFLWEGISNLLSRVATIFDEKEAGLGTELKQFSVDLKQFADAIADYRGAMEVSEFALAAEHLDTASNRLAVAAKSCEICAYSAKSFS
jgi:hypothetical protein